MSRTRWLLSLACALAAACQGEATNSLDLPLDPHSGLRVPELPPLPPLPEWPDNQPTEEKKALGRLLFFDARLSGSGAMRCSNCHLPAYDFHSANVTDVPDRSYPNLVPTLHRHTPSLQNIVYAPMLRADGSYFTDLYDMMVLPFAEPNMNSSQLSPEAGEQVDIPGAQAALYRKLTKEIPGYIPLFRSAFGVDLSEQSPSELWRLMGKALAVYIRTVTTYGAPFDAWNAGDDAAIGDDAKRGAVLFAGKAKCVVCHSGALLSDFKFHNISTELPGPDGRRDDEGRFLVTGREEDRGAFLTPMLRGASQTSPYLHDGSKHGLRTVIRHLSEGHSTDDPQSDPLSGIVPPLSDDEIDDIVAFIKTLDGIRRDIATLPKDFPQ